VGDNLQDHALLYLQYQTRDPTQPVPTQTMLTWHNGLRPDQVSLHLFPYGPIASETGPVLCLLVGVMQPLSRGWLKLSSQDPRGTPQIDPGLLTRPEDLDTMTAGVILARQIAGSAPLKNHLTREKWPGSDVRTKNEIAAAVRASVVLTIMQLEHAVWEQATTLALSSIVAEPCIDLPACMWPTLPSCPRSLRRIRICLR